MKKSFLVNLIRGETDGLPHALYYATFGGETSFIKAIRKIISVALIAQSQHEYLNGELSVNPGGLDSGKAVEIKNAARLIQETKGKPFLASAHAPHAPVLSAILKWLDLCESDNDFIAGRVAQIDKSAKSKTLLRVKDEWYSPRLCGSSAFFGTAKYREQYEAWALKIADEDVAGKPVPVTAAIAYESYLFKAARNQRLSAQSAKRLPSATDKFSDAVADDIAGSLLAIYSSASIGTALWRICLLRRRLGRTITALSSDKALSQIAQSHRDRILNKVLGAGSVKDPAKRALQAQISAKRVNKKLAEQFAITKFYKYDPDTGVLHNLDLMRDMAPSALTVPNPVDDKFVSTKRVVMFVIFEQAGLTEEDAKWFIPRQIDETAYGTYSYWKADNFWFKAKGGAPAEVVARVQSAGLCTAENGDV